MPSTALISGTSRGLGRALALGLAQAGYRVYGTGRDGESLERLRMEAERDGLDVRPIRADVTSVEDNARVATTIGDDGVKVNALVHNAGLLGPPRTALADYDPEEFRRVVEVNLFGPFDLTRQLVPVLAPGAAILFVTSGASLGPRRGWGAYNISKMALDGLAGVWAAELRDRGLRVFLVDPGAMRTGMRAAAYPREDPATLAPPEARTRAFLDIIERTPLEQTVRRIDVG